jgi:hypothetical protein
MVSCAIESLLPGCGCAPPLNGTVLQYPNPSITPTVITAMLRGFTRKQMSVNKILHFAFMHDLAQMAQKVKLHGVVFTTVDLTVQDMGTAR